MDYSHYQVGQRIRLTRSQSCSGGDGPVRVSEGTLATVASTSDSHLRAWLDSPVYELPLDADEFAALDEIWSEEQRLILSFLSTRESASSGEIDALLRAALDVPPARSTRYWDRYVLYILA